jgi:acyl transferase domain-containing protein
MPEALSAEDAAVAQKLGIGGGTDEPDGTEDTGQGQEHEEQTDQESKLEDLPESWQAEIRRLRNENAAQRIKARTAQKAAPAEGDTPAAIEARVRETIRLEYGVKLAKSEVTASLKGVVPDALIGAVVGKLDLAQFVGEDGDPDADAITALHDEYVALLGTVKKPASKVGHGRTNGAPSAKTNAETFAELFNSKLS